MVCIRYGGLILWCGKEVLDMEEGEWDQLSAWVVRSFRGILRVYGGIYRLQKLLHDGI